MKTCQKKRRLARRNNREAITAATKKLILGSLVMKIMIILAATLVISTGAACAQDVAAGENSFKKCSICHSIGEGATNKIGPKLNGLDGRKSEPVAGLSCLD